MYLDRRSDTPDAVEYEAITADFSQSGAWEVVAGIQIDKRGKTYSFHPKGPWQGHHVLPPSFFSLAESEQKKLYEGEYGGAEFGAWTSRLHSWIDELLREEAYPPRAPKPR